MLTFHYGTMGSGKSLRALQSHYQLTEAGYTPLLLTGAPRKDGTVSSRIGVSQPAYVINPMVTLDRLLYPLPSHVIVDEAQFLTISQVEILAKLDIPVYCYGLLTSFQGELFPGSKRLIELADVKTELETVAMCYVCGDKAIMNVRLVDGRPVFDGPLQVLGDTDDADVSYRASCRRHWQSPDE